MGSIQSSINQSIGSIAAMAGLSRLVKGQKTIAASTDNFSKLIKESKPVYEGHEAGYNQGLEDIQELYDPRTGDLNESVMQEVLTNPAYEGTTGRATVEAIIKSKENLTSNQVMTAFQNMNLKERKEFLRQGQHYQSQQKRIEQHRNYEEARNNGGNL